MSGPSNNLTWAELACRDGTPYPIEFIDEGRAVILAALFEAVRTLLGDQPLAVVSAYRTPAWNRRIGGAPRSQHVEGRALDLHPPAGMTVEAMYRAIYDARETLPGLGGFGRYRTFCHVDTRPRIAHRLVVWNGRGQQKDDRA